jgi:hypothetical protein
MFTILKQSCSPRRSVQMARLALTLLVALSFVLSLPRQTGLASSNNAPTNSEKTPEKKVKTFKGAAVKRQVEKRRLKNKGLERAIREYAKKGLSPNWEESVLVQQLSETSAINKPKGLFERASYVTQQETYVEGDSEITFITYSGDLTYWDGIVYVHTPYQDDTYSGDFLTPTDDGTNWDVVNEVYYPPDGRTPCDGSRPCMMEEQVSKASGQQAGGKGVSLSHGGAKTVKPGLWGWLKNWWNCVVWNCWAEYYNCNGSFRFLCRVTRCAWGMFRCL